MTDSKRYTGLVTGNIFTSEGELSQSPVPPPANAAKYTGRTSSDYSGRPPAPPSTNQASTSQASSPYYHPMLRARILATTHTADGRANLSAIVRDAAAELQKPVTQQVQN